MKKFITLFLFIFSFTVLFAQEEGKTPSVTLNTVIKTENPNAYQKEQIKKFFNDTAASAQLEENVAGVLELINRELPASAIRSYSLKDAFPEAAGADPKGFFDSYNRALFAYSILEALGKDKNMHIVDFSNQALFVLKKPTTDNAAPNNSVEFDTFYFTTMEPKDVYYPVQDELDRSNILYTQDDVKSLLLTRIAQEKIKEGNGEELSIEEPDVTLLKQAETLLKQALNLNPRNATAINTLKALINVMPTTVYNANKDRANKKKLEIITNYDILLLALKVANFNNNYETKQLDPFVCNNTPYCPKKSKVNNTTPLITAIQDNADIRNYVTEIMLALYSLDNYKTMLALGNEYAKIKGIDNIENIYNFYFQMAMANAMMRNYKNFQKFKRLFDRKYLSAKEELSNLNIRLNNVAVAMEIVSGKKSAAKLAMEYNNGLGGRVHTYVATGHVNENAFESALVLQAWPGYKVFRNQFLELID